MAMQVEIVLEYQGQEARWIEDVYHHPGGRKWHPKENTPDEDWRLCVFLWEEGNFSCDCNRSEFAQRHGYDWPELECGDTIKLVSMRRIDT